MIYLLDLTHDTQKVESCQFLEVLHLPQAGAYQLREQRRVAGDILKALGGAETQLYMTRLSHLSEIFRTHSTGKYNVKHSSANTLLAK